MSIDCRGLKADGLWSKPESAVAVAVWSLCMAFSRQGLLLRGRKHRSIEGEAGFVTILSYILLIPGDMAYVV